MANPEQALWRAVIDQAITDVSVKSTLCDANERDRAHSWLFRYNRDFLAVCALADVEPHQVRARALARIKEEEIKRQRKLERKLARHGTATPNDHL